MKKKFSYCILAFATAMSFSLASCGDDDEPENNDTKPTPVDTTDVNPVDTATVIPSDTTTVTPSNPTEDPNTQENTQYTLDDVQGLWHAKKEGGYEIYVEIKGENTRLIERNTEYPEEEKWICLSLAGNNVTDNIFGYSTSFLTNAYGFKLKKITDTEMVTTPSSEYFANEDGSIDDVTFTKMSELPSFFSEPGFIFQFSMDYTSW